MITRTAGGWRWNGALVGLALGLLAPLWGCAAPEKRGPAPHTEEPWSYGGREGRKLITAHYEIYTTVSDAYLVDTFPTLMEAAFARYASLVPPARADAGPMPLYLFATRAEWADFTRRTFPPERARVLLRVRNGGYAEQGVAAMQYVSHAITFPLLTHEGFHQYLHHHVNPRVPAWLNEGLAVYCEGMRWTGDWQVDFDPWQNGLRRNTLAERLVAGRTMPLPDLLRTHAGLVMEGPPSLVGTYYSQVWALMLFLREGADGKYAPALERLTHALGDPDLERRAKAAYITADSGAYDYGEYLFRAFITSDLESFEQEYVAYMRLFALGQR